MNTADDDRILVPEDPEMSCEEIIIDEILTMNMDHLRVRFL